MMPNGIDRYNSAGACNFVAVCAIIMKQKEFRTVFNRAEFFINYSFLRSPSPRCMFYGLPAKQGTALMKCCRIGIYSASGS